MAARRRRAAGLSAPAERRLVGCVSLRRAIVDLRPCAATQGERHVAHFTSRRLRRRPCLCGPRRRPGRDGALHRQARRRLRDAGGRQQGKPASLDATYDTATKTLSWTITYSGLTGQRSMAHFHGPAPVGKAAAVMVPIKGSLDSPIKGSAKLTDAEAKALIDGDDVFQHPHRGAQARRDPRPD